MPYKDPETQRAYQREWCARRRAKWFADKVCVDCESVDRLELDHVDPALKVTNSVWSWSWARIEAEVAKCVVRCHGCHVLKTTRNNETGFKRRLSDDDVSVIREQRAAGVSASDLADSYGCTAGYIRDLVSRYRQG